MNGIIEYNSGIYDVNGIDIQDAKAYFVKNGTFAGYDGAAEVVLENQLELMERPCDILVPAATEKSIHRGNAEKL